MFQMQEARRIKTYFDPFAKGFDNEGLRDAYYRLTCEARQGGLILEACTFAEADSLNDGEDMAGMVLEAVRVRAFSRTAQTMAALQRALNRYLADKGFTVGEAEIGKPKKSGLFATVTVQFPVSDGQTITIIFHSPDGNKMTITAQDEILAFRWLLNKRDITVAVSPEGEADVSLEEVGKRVAMLVEKNAKAFASKQKEIVEQKANLESLKSTVEAEQAANAAALQSLTENQAQSEKLDGEIAKASEQLSKVQDFNAELQAKLDAARAVQKGNEGKATGGDSNYESSAADYATALTSLGFEPDAINANVFNLKYVDENWGKAGPGSQSLEKLSTIYGVEPSGTVAVIVTGAGANKKFTAKSEATARNAFDKAIVLVTELAGRVVSFNAWLAKYSPAVSGVVVGDRFKVSINRRKPTDGYFNDPAIVTNVGDATDGNNPGLPAIRLSIGTHTTNSFAYNAWADAVANKGIAPFDAVATIDQTTNPEPEVVDPATEIDPTTPEVPINEMTAAVNAIGGNITGKTDTEVFFMFHGGVSASLAAVTGGFSATNIDTGAKSGTVGSIDEALSWLKGIAEEGDANIEQEAAAVEILDDIIGGKYTTSQEISEKLDEAAAALEAVGQMDAWDGKLNSAADYLTDVLAKEAA